MWKAIKAYFGDFKDLAKLPREFWGVQVLNLAYMWIYFTFVTLATLHLTQDVGFSDVGTGWVFTIFVFGSAVMMIFMGPIMDLLGYRKTGLIASAVLVVGLVGIGASPVIFGAGLTAKIMVIVFYCVAMVGNGLMTPVVMAGTKRFSNKETQGPAYNLWYLTMNIGAILIFTLDFMRRALGEKGVKPTPEQIAAFRDAGGNSHVMYILGAVALLCGLVVFIMIRKEEQFPDFKQSDEEDKPKEEQKPNRSLGQILSEVVKDKQFRKVFGFLLLTIPAHIPFVVVFVLYPRYWTRVLSADVSLGTFSALNPIIIVSGLILLMPVVKRFNVYWVLVTGMIIGGSSIAILAIPPHWLMSMLGTSLEQTYYIMVLTQISFFAFGELIWSPQLMNYVAKSATPGNEGTFMGVARIPFTTAKLIAALGAGYLLQRYCPDGVKLKIMANELSYMNSPEFMFLMLSLLCLTSPIAILLLKKHFYTEEKAGDA